MKAGRLLNGWTLAALMLTLVIIAGGIIIFFKGSGSPGIEISIAAVREIDGNIYVSGGVNNPGLYPLYAGDSLETIILAAGGIKDNTNPGRIELSIDPADTDSISQKIDINRAEMWLLEALPGVGEAKAQAIIAYRQENGLFHDINELMSVPGFGETNFNAVKALITVGN